MLVTRNSQGDAWVVACTYCLCVWVPVCPYRAHGPRMVHRLLSYWYHPRACFCCIAPCVVPATHGSLVPPIGFRHALLAAQPAPGDKCEAARKLETDPVVQQFKTCAKASPVPPDCCVKVGWGLFAARVVVSVGSTQCICACAACTFHNAQRAQLGSCSPFRTGTIGVRARACARARIIGVTRVRSQPWCTGC